MNINCLILSQLLIVFLSINSCAQQNTEKRLSLAKEFVEVFKEGVLSNEQIMKQYVAEGYYFKVDTLREMADGWMNLQRDGLQTIHKKNIAILKYLDHEDEFIVPDNPEDCPLCPPVMQKLRFKLDAPNEQDLDLDLNDLYVIQDKKSKAAVLFVLFNKKNEIITFSGLRFESKVSLWKW